MIVSLKIKNYTLLKDVSIDFKNGFTVISGETGSGKSILLDALSLLLGKRAERFSVHNTSKTIIEGVFSVGRNKLSFFEKYNLDYEQLTILRRELKTDGKSRAFINDTPVLLNVLAEFSNQVIEIHSQHQSVLLKDEVTQFNLIDQLAKSKKELLLYQKELNKYNKLNKELEFISNSGNFSDSEIEFFKYQFDELESYNLKIGENETIKEQIDLLENVEEIFNTISETDQYLNNDLGILSQLSDIKRKIKEFEPLEEFCKRIESVIIELNDISNDLSSIKDKTKSNPEELISYKNRLDAINQLLQKHKKRNIADLLNYQKEIKDKIKLSTLSEIEIKRKKKEIEEQLVILQNSANTLNNKRTLILPKFKKNIEKNLINLGMPYAQFEVRFTELNHYHKHGNSSISFLFSANKGRSLLEISKVASGGEISRLMLAIKYISAKSEKLDALIFDEIDTGVSGKIASLMAIMMREISKSTQIISISHLPQIASKADEHFKVLKSVINDETISNIKTLNKEERITEIAKLLSGKEITSEAFENARVLLSQ